MVTLCRLALVSIYCCVSSGFKIRAKPDALMAYKNSVCSFYYLIFSWIVYKAVAWWVERLTGNQVMGSIPFFLRKKSLCQHEHFFCSYFQAEDIYTCN